MPGQIKELQPKVEATMNSKQKPKQPNTRAAQWTLEELNELQETVQIAVAMMAEIKEERDIS